jgi:hypothetical protein
VPIATIVECAFGSLPLAASPTWTDITRYVDMGDEITIQRGAADELEEIPGGTLTFTLDNSDARFTPGLASSPYYPNVRKGVRIRVRQVHVHANYCLNGGFESAAVTDWAAFGSTPPTLSASTTHAHEGTYGMRIVWATGTTANGAQTTLYGLQVGRQYTASAWVWVTGGATAVRLGVSGIATGTASSTTGAWQQISYTWTATATSHVVQVTPAAGTTSGHDVWVDEVMVAEGTAVATYDATAPLISARFNGFVNRWPVSWPGGHKVARSRMTATDLFKPLTRRQLRSALEEEVLIDGPLAYYPLSEPAGSTSAGDLSGTVGGSLAVTGTGGELTFAAGTGPGADGLSCPVFAPSSSTVGQYLLSDMGSDFEIASVDGFIRIEAWFSTTVTGRVLLAMRTVDAMTPARLAIQLETGTGKLQMVWSIGEIVSPTTSTWATANLADGEVHHVVYDEQDGRIYIDGVSQGTQSRLVMRRLRRLSVGSDFGTGYWDGGISHVAVYTSWSDLAARTATHYDAGTTGIEAEAADDRLARLAGYAGVTLTTEGTLFDPVANQGGGGKSALALMREISNSESGRLFADRADGLRYQSRDVRYAPASAVTLDAADCGPPVYADDDQFLINRVDASRPGGALIRVEDTESQGYYFVYPKTLSLFKASDAAVVDAAQWMINRYADPAPRISAVEVEGATLGTTTYRALLGLEISDAFTVTGLPSQAPSTSELLTVEGWREVIGPEHHTWVFNTSPALVDQVWSLDSSTRSQLDDTTRLAY